jgi:hypothetical protein
MTARSPTPEDSLLHLLAAPTELLVEGAGPTEVDNAKGDETHALLHVAGE